MNVTKSSWLLSLSLLHVGCAQMDEVGAASAALYEIDDDGPEESICGGAADFQHVERYDGTDGVTTAWVAEHQTPVGQIQWKSDLKARYSNPGNVEGKRWCSGTLITPELFLTAAHCFEEGDGWTWPTDNATGSALTPEETAKEMQVNFNYQLDASGNLQAEDSYTIAKIVSYRRGGLDYAYILLDGFPGDKYGIQPTNGADIPAKNSRLTIIGHPAGQPKQLDTGNMTSIEGSRITYGDIDTLGGNSGSGVLNEAGQLVGVHTHGGCTGPSGTNSGVLYKAITDAENADPTD